MLEFLLMELGDYLFSGFADYLLGLLGYRMSTQDVSIRTSVESSGLMEEAIIEKRINNGDPYGVRDHIRNLPVGWHASDSHIKMAQEMGIELKENQTIVPSYFKNKGR